MFPPLRSITVFDCLNSEFKALAFHNQRPRSALAQENTPKRVSSFDTWIDRILHYGYYCDGYHQYLVRHIEQYICLNTQELEKLHNTITSEEANLQMIYGELSDIQNLIQYARMLVHLDDPDVIGHRRLIKKRLQDARVRYKDVKFSVKCSTKHIGKLWAVYSEETKRTCDFEDDEAPPS
ncbi:hypothetical protein DFH28DRAFT_905901 [Melampsora americana]|nr:hypothetical protein DFH28DRAFT_905901 [Melampsora americana]